MTEPRDYKDSVRKAALDDPSFLGLTFSRSRGGGTEPWARIRVRPVRVKGERRLQFSYFDGRQYVTKNADGAEAMRRLDEALSLPFGEIHAQTGAGDLHVKVTKKGRVLVATGKPSRPEAEPDLAHDREKDRALHADPDDPLLRALGIVTPSGAIVSGMQAKFHQINEFLRVIDRVIPRVDGRAGGAGNSQLTTDNSQLLLLDCGCGSAYLTFAAYHHLTHQRGLAVRVVGIDTNEELIRRCVRLRDSLDWESIDFRAARIADFDPERPPDIVLSLHACDTATDEALALGVRWKSRVILAAPCCQHELHQQLKTVPLRAVLHHGILRERLADIVTDAFRALALRIAGYRTSVVEFISPDRTAKNLMIQAERGLRPGAPASVQEYNDLKAFWGVTPAIERLLGEEFERLIHAPE